MLPALIIPNMIWKKPATIVAHISNRKPAAKSGLPFANTGLKVAKAPRIIATSPAAGPLTLRCDLLKEPMMIPPITPDTIPENKGALDAWAIPRHKGKAIKKTIRPDIRSFFAVAKKDFL
jgi:hypothetical protein